MQFRAWGSAFLLSLFIVLSFVVLTSRKPTSLKDPLAMCPAIRDVALSPLDDQNFNGESETAEGKFHDHFLFDRDHKFKVGVRDEWNGTIFFAGQDKNLLDDSAADRALQVAFHDDTRAEQGCAGHAACEEANTRYHACGDKEKFPGWTAAQGINACGFSARPLAFLANGSGLNLSFSAVQKNPKWKLSACEAFGCEKRPPLEFTGLRVHQRLSFVRPGVLEVEYIVTNPEETEVAAVKGLKHEFPRLFAASGLDHLSGVRNAEATDKREPASADEEQNLFSDHGWVGFFGKTGEGLGLLWENRNGEIVSLLDDRQTQVRSNFAFALRAAGSTRGRFYLLLGTSHEVEQRAEKLEHELAPFGRIDVNDIDEDTRTVKLEGWALDNKAIKKLELYVDGSKVKDLKLDSSREDICGEYPGYKMCKAGMRVGFRTTYARPAGQGCEKTIEVRATDDDGNVRTIARSGISPVSY